jgi:hypothetical protein
MREYLHTQSVEDGSGVWAGLTRRRWQRGCRRRAAWVRTCWPCTNQRRSVNSSASSSPSDLRSSLRRSPLPFLPPTPSASYCHDCTYSTPMGNLLDGVSLTRTLCHPRLTSLLMLGGSPTSSPSTSYVSTCPLSTQLTLPLAAHRSHNSWSRRHRPSHRRSRSFQAREGDSVRRCDVCRSRSSRQGSRQDVRLIRRALRGSCA